MTLSLFSSINDQFLKILLHLISRKKYFWCLFTSKQNVTMDFVYQKLLLSLYIFFEKSFSPSLPPTCLTTSCTKIAKRLVVFKFHIWAKRFHYNAHYSKVLKKGKFIKRYRVTQMKIWYVFLIAIPLKLDVGISILCW